MKYIICKDQAQFDALDKAAVAAWNEKFPNGLCEKYATPKGHPVDGRLAFPIEEKLGIDYVNAVELDDSWELPQDPEARAREIAAASYDAALSKGYDTGLGYSLSVAERSQNRFGTMMSGLKNIAPPNETPMPLWDQEGGKHMITYGQFKTIMQGYTMFCLGIEP